jgi:hypothetical protein
LYLCGYTDPVTSRPVIIYTLAKLGDIGLWPKRKALTPFDQKMTGCNQKILIFWCFSQDNSKQWAMRRLSQLLVLALSSSSILLYQFLQPAIGGRG